MRAYRSGGYETIKKLGVRPPGTLPPAANLDTSVETPNQVRAHGSLIFSTVFNIYQEFEFTEFFKVDDPSALCLFGPIDSSGCCGVTIRLYEGSKNQRVIGQCLERV
jgi:hypothetical protein